MCPPSEIQTEEENENGPNETAEPSGLIKITEISEPDLNDGFLETLDNLIPGTSLIGGPEAARTLREIKSNPLHKIFVAKAGRADTNNAEHLTVAGTTTLLVEPKFIFNGGRFGHIEDVSVRKGFEKLGIGSKLVSHATSVAKEMGCVKVILDCSNETMPFYEKLGYTYQDNCMKKVLADQL